MSEDFFLKSMQGGRKWNNMFKVLNEKECATRILYPVKMFPKRMQNKDIFKVKLSSQYGMFSPFQCASKMRGKSIKT